MDYPIIIDGIKATQQEIMEQFLDTYRDLPADVYEQFRSIAQGTYDRHQIAAPFEGGDFDLAKAANLFVNMLAELVHVRQVNYVMSTFLTESLEALKEHDKDRAEQLKGKLEMLLKREFDRVESAPIH